ncbi:hypothetical protein HMPREF9193_01081 [Treponema lecithinolyticum ATCC 700332]|uniref:Uncharacterized protein n=1 Tax=Treponema lecithinolyticum ATCC 700332 TaxID=1321815 RepID=A0ABN0NZE6_TRELE|nr:hypothetical protein HMPREF9193_01081 [Treponema lecithinolyticum ATCC 700332]
MHAFLIFASLFSPLYLIQILAKHIYTIYFINIFYKIDYNIENKVVKKNFKKKLKEINFKVCRT